MVRFRLIAGVMMGVMMGLIMVAPGCEDDPAERSRFSLDASLPTGGQTGVTTNTDGDTGPTDAQNPSDDQDADGLLDADEQWVFAQYAPAIYADLELDLCPTRALIYRVSPHPSDPQLWVLRVVLVFESSCGGLSQSVGHAAYAAVTLDPSWSGSASVHGMTLNTTTVCGAAYTCAVCDAGGLPCQIEANGTLPALLSTNSHRLYPTAQACLSDACLGPQTCSDQGEPLVWDALNVGEPSAPLSSDLTSDGLITPALGWQAVSLHNYDPWGPKPFGDTVALRALLDAPAPPPCP